MSDVWSHVQGWIEEHHDVVLSWRRHLHSHPELSHREYETTDFLEQVLRSYGLEPVRFPDTGLRVDLGPDTGEKLAFRADIDALPITEITGLDFASEKQGYMHACGHDVHTTIALATACALSSFDLNLGVRFIFQPAEEVLEGGAPEVISYGALEGVGSIYALHVEPKLKVGKVGVRTGAITSAADSLTITVSGHGGHSARPHLTEDVVYALGALVTQLPGLLSRRVDPRSGTVLAFGSVKAGFAANALPQHGVLLGTVRTADIRVWRMMQPLMEELIQQVVAPTGCEAQVRYVRGVPPVVNDDVATAVLADAATSVDPHAVVEAPQSSGGEDFSWYLEHVPGSMARLGCWDGTGTPGDLHQGDLVVDERAISVGIRLFAAILKRYLATDTGASNPEIP
ncbi:MULTISPECIES: amidohydrolase [Corynebacterium]|uniref:amidohydrolase n=1 Tax=Corynebacterium TaxID=1716 RepID=UPI00124CC276|nr:MULTISPECIES: amidohydrolase [Corynebacterium]MBV7282805.1 amidohydrolase [Corynebacterium sp. TAE3-ERU30]